MRRIVVLISICLGLAALTARAAHTHVQLLLSDDTAKPGNTIWAGVDIKMDPGWHTYWKNPGDSGIATTIKWELPPGVTAGEIQWPLPEKFPPIEVTTYGYTNEVMLLVPLTLATNLPPGPLALKADVAWLECQESCVPGSTNVEATLNVGGETKISADAATIESWKSKTPETNNVYQFQAWWEKPAENDTRPLIINYGPTPAAKNITFSSVDFFPDASDQFEVQPATETVSAQSAYIRLRKVVKKYSGDWPRKISGVIVIESGKQRFGYDVNFPINDEASAGATAAITSTTPTSHAPLTPPFWQMLLYAFIGGLILESHAVRAAGHRAENPRLRRRGQQRTAPRPQARIDLCTRRA